MKEKFFTIDGLVAGEIVEKKSRFIAQICHVESEDEALTFIADVKKEHIQARHNVYAYIVGAQSSATQRIRFTDDGEPSQTAGKPTLETLQHASLCNVACVVTRYFGGTLLGTGGLVRAYSGAVKAAIENAQAEGLYHEVVEYDEKVETCSYSAFEQLKRIIEQQNGIILNVDYAEEVTVQFKVPKA
ncbi:MAG: YigZ family protein [Phoenicibacter congonensis]|uniref:YigZ family protein n=1 Tax=Phoenicibacter congonensis TaxID=1944646 RepID=A0AA43U937_9ACTN|nr:YigZ family protein [Phoenicibacter congonensis]